MQSSTRVLAKQHRYTRDSSARLEAESVLNPMRILLAEDDAYMRSLVASTLRADGYDVVEAENGSDLLDGIDELLLWNRDGVALDLVISDVRMPGRSGLEVLAEMRRSDWATPVILITAFGDRALHEEAARLGTVAVLDKPFSMEKLRKTVKGLLGGGRQAVE